MGQAGMKNNWKRNTRYMGVFAVLAAVFCMIAKINAKIQLVLPYTQSQSISKNGKGITYKYNCPELR